ncbi:MAG TPA: ABC transporter ATP-binding protein, partial [Solirubrobacterales bacterium]|nr:ABC transporter ATP-binding protein [Solirubrobacterales bacterium]
MTGSTPPVLEARGLERTYGAGATMVRALQGVDLAVAEGEMVAIMGPSGSGKSTLLHILGALDHPDGGSVEISGRRYDDLSDRELTELRGDVFGFVFQFFNLLPTLTAAENVLLPALVNGERPGRRAARVDELMELVGLGDRAAHLPSELSGGEQQRVAIARALLREPTVVLADEPTGNLDSTSGAAVMALLRRVVDEGQTVVMVTHDPSAAALADRVIFL